MGSEALLASAKILIVDDDWDMLELCASILRLAGYVHIVTTPDPRGVLALFVEYNPDILILDINMPYLDGLQLLAMLQQVAPEGLTLPVIVTTALPTPDQRYQALSIGAVDVLAKPFDSQEFVLRISNLLKIRMALRDVETQSQALFQELLDRTEALACSRLELKEAQLEVIARLARAGEQHDDNTGQHTQRVAVTAGLLAQELGLSRHEVEVLQRAAPLHDVGKLGIPDSILLKSGRLTTAERVIMQRHCSFGSELLSGGRSEIVQMAECLALTHHERWNGCGYPRGLDKENVPLQGRILAVADVFDALTHQRTYKTAWSVDAAMAEIRRQAGQQFDPQVVAAFLQLPHLELV